MNGRLVLSTSLLMLALVPGAAPASDWTWSPAGSLLESTRGLATSARLADGRVLIAGGDNYGSVFSSVERYDPGTNAWSAIEPMAGPHGWAAGVSLSDGRVLVAGGRKNNLENTKSAEVYDPKTGHWTSAGTMNEGRGMPLATLLADGRVLVVGGDSLYTLSSGAETWDPKTNVWTTTGPPKQDREGGAIARLHDGRVLVAGGWNADELNTVELFDPATGTWSSGPPLSSARNGLMAVTLQDGRVLVAGGNGFNSSDLTFFDSATAELFDPATGTWTRTGSLNVARGTGTLSVLPDGRAVMAGGFTQVGSTSVSTTEIYDPATGIWTLAPSLRRARAQHIAEVLQDGSLLVAGGFDGGAPAERFRPGTDPTTTPTPTRTATPTATPTPIATVMPVASATATPVPQPPAQRPGVPKLAKLAKTLKLTRAGTLSVKVTCSPEGTCHDSLVLEAGKTTLAKTNVNVARGATTMLTLKLSKASLRKVSRKGTKVTVELTGAHVVMKTSLKKK